MVRGAFYDENGIKKGAWSEEEDDKLKSYIHTHGHPNWRQLPKLAGLARCGKSCRLRWMNYLRPNLKHGNYTPQEEQIIIKLHQQHGNKWSLIAEKLPGRTDNDVKNHWHSQLKRRNINCDDDELNLKVLKKPSHDHDHDHDSSSQSEIIKVVVDEFHNIILESSSLMCTEMSTSASASGEENCANSLASVDVEYSSLNSQDQEDNSEQASWEPNRFQELSGDFWTEPFIPENSFTQYCYDHQIGTATQHFFSYDAADLY